MSREDHDDAWTDDAVLDDKRRRDGSVSVNIILSMPPGTEPSAIQNETP